MAVQREREFGWVQGYGCPEREDSVGYRTMVVHRERIRLDTGLWLSREHSFACQTTTDTAVKILYHAVSTFLFVINVPHGFFKFVLPYYRTKNTAV
jgi:hypothetical protein